MVKSTFEKSAASASSKRITVDNPMENEFLYIQWNEDGTDKVKAFQPTAEKCVYTTEDGIPADLANCKIWIEKKDTTDNLVYAKMAHIHAFENGVCTDANCNMCESVATTGNHNFTTYQCKNLTSHTKKCAECGYVSAEESHSFTNGKCACGVSEIAKDWNCTYVEKDDLGLVFSLDSDSSIAGKVNFGKRTDTVKDDNNEDIQVTSSQTWYIAGKNADGTLVLMCDLEKPMKTGQKFNSSTSNGIYDGSEVYANHYGASDLRTYLTSDEGALSNFTSAEQSMMADTSIYTNDIKNSNTYKLTDKLYAAYGDINDSSYITVGNNSAGSLNNGLKIALTGSGKYASGNQFWLRAPDVGNCNNELFVNHLFDNLFSNNVFLGKGSVVPAMHLNLSSVLFASVATSAASDAEVSDAMTFRMDGTGKVSSTAVYDNSGIKVTKGGDNEVIYIQYNEGTTNKVWSKAITEDMNIYKDCVGVDSFANCKIWIEKKGIEKNVENKDVDTNLVYAVMATSGTVGITGHTYVADTENGNHKCKSCGTQANHDFLIEGEGGKLNNDTTKEACTSCGVKNIAYEDIEIGIGKLDYNGSSQTPTVTIKDNGVNLVSGTDYEVDVTGKTEHGATDYTITITGKGNYAGSVTKNWNIDKIAPSKENIAYTAPSNLTYDGEGKTATLEAKTGVNGLGTITTYYKLKGSEEAMTTTAPKNAGTYEVYADVAEGTNYNASSSKLYIDEFIIARATPSYTVPTDLKADCGAKLSTVTLPKGFTWASEDGALSADDTKANSTVTKKAKFTPTDTTNYSVVEDIDVEITVTHDTKTVQIAGQNKHHDVCKNTACTYAINEENCSGGTATCKVLATCDTCKASYGSYEAHTWNAGEITKTSTCSEKGEKTFTCTVAGCGATKKEDVATNPDNHTYVNGVCSGCNKAYETKINGVTYQVVTKTDETTGKVTAKTVNDEKTGKETIAVTIVKVDSDVEISDGKYEIVSDVKETTASGEADQNFIVTAVSADAFKDVTEVKEIVVPETVTEVGKDAFGDADSVAFNSESAPEGIKEAIKDEATVKVPEEYADSYKTELGDEATIIEVHVHKYATNWTSDDKYHWHASACNHAEETSDKAEHSKDAGTRVEPTCESKGTITYKCSVCGYTLEVVNIDALGHKWDNGTVTKEATEDAEGVKTYHCTNEGCTKTKTESIAKLDKKAPSTGDNTTETNKTPSTGDVVSDKTTGAKVEVLNPSKKEVAYVAPSNKKNKEVKIPGKVVVNGVTYKVTKIDDGAFKGNKTVTKVTLPNSIKTIGKDAFNGCSKLKTISVPKTVTEIGANAFKGCSSLTKLILQSKTTKIGANAFYGCKKLKTITIKATKLTTKTVAKNAFKGLSKSTVIKVPKKQLKAYKKLFKSKGFKGTVKA